MRVGLLTGGGDCPGLNAVIRAVVQRVGCAGGECVGIVEGWRGLVQNRTMPLPMSLTEGIIARGGTILGASRTNPFKNPEDVQKVHKHYAALGLDALIVIGGDDTLLVAYRLWNEAGMPVVAVPKTIDNDLMATEFTFGFDTAVNVVTEAVDRLRTTAESHRRVMVVETMGRHAGWIACFSGMAVAADFIFVPEVPIDIERCAEVLRRHQAQGKPYGLVIVSEGARFPGDKESTATAQPLDLTHLPLGSIGRAVAQRIERLTGMETRDVVLGHIQRGGTPSAYDRVLATRFGLAAADLVDRERFGMMVSLQGGRIVEAPLTEAVAAIRTLDLNYYNEAATFFA
jgi:6-phosphofructokinase 1